MFTKASRKEYNRVEYSVHDGEGTLLEHGVVPAGEGQPDVSHLPDTATLTMRPVHRDEVCKTGK